MKVRKYFFFALLLLVGISCDDDGVIGEAIRPTQDLLQVKSLSGTNIELSSYHPEAIQTDGQSQMLLGAYWQKDFGTISSEIAMQFRFDTVFISKEKVEANQVVIDTVYLVLYFQQYKGDSISLNKLDVYELSKKLEKSERYFSNENPEDYYSEDDLLGSGFFTGKVPGVSDSLYNSVGYVNEIKVPLKRELAERLLENFDVVADANSLDNYQEFFKGLYIKPSLGNRTLVYIPTAISADSVLVSSIQFYYHYKNDDGSEEELIRKQDFWFTSECQRFNRFDYDFEGSVFEDSEEIITEDLYIRGMGGANIRVKLPNIETHPELQKLPGNDSLRIAINSATLNFYVNQNKIDANEEEMPGRIVIRQDSVDQNTGTSTYIRLIDDDESFDSSIEGDYIDGFLNEDYSYTINITEQVQYWLANPEEQKDLILMPVNSASQPALTILNGANSAENPFELEIIYTRY